MSDITLAETATEAPKRPFRSSHRRYRAACVWLLLVTVGGVALWLSLSVVDAAHPGDFVQEYLLAKALADRTDPLVPIPDLARRYTSPEIGAAAASLPHPTPHPPTAGVLLLPLAALHYWKAFAVWTALQLLFLLAAVHGSLHMAGVELNRRWIFALTCAGLAWDPIFDSVHNGQLMLPLLALGVAAWRALADRRHALAGALLGVSILLKPILWPVILLLLVRRPWSGVFAAAAITGLGWAIVMLAASPQALWRYVTYVLPQVALGYGPASGNLSLWSIGHRVFGPTLDDPAAASPPPMVDAPAVGLAATVVIPLLVLSLCLWFARRDDLRTGFPSVLAVSAILSPLAWISYLVVAVPAAVLLVRALPPRPRPARLLSFAALAALLIPVSALVRIGPNWPLLLPLALLLVVAQLLLLPASLPPPAQPLKLTDSRRDVGAA